MIGFANCTKLFRLEEETKVILDSANLAFNPTDRVCILARAGDGKTTITAMLAGLEAPTKGEVLRDNDISWPLGFAGAFHPAISGEKNVRIIADLSNINASWVSAYVAEFAQLGDDFYQPVQSYSSGMRARLAFALSMAVPAKTYLADNNIGTGDSAFRLKCEVAFEKRLADAGLFCITQSLRIAERFGNTFGVLRNGRFEMQASFQDAKAIFEDYHDEFSDVADIVGGFTA